jgi:hypothetical protein
MESGCPNFVKKRSQPIGWLLFEGSENIYPA